MANEYYERLSEMNPGDLADGLAMEAEFDAIAQGFSKLPTPHTGGQGFEGPVRVGDATAPDEAINKKQLDEALGTAKQLAVATYGNFNATAWATLPSGTYLLFGTGSQITNSPFTLAEAKTYYLAVRHAIGDNLYFDAVVMSSLDDDAHVDIGREAWRAGPALVSSAWRAAALKTGALAPLEGLTPAADKIAVFNGPTGAELITLTAFIRTLLDDVDAASALATLGALASSSYNPRADSLNNSGGGVLVFTGDCDAMKAGDFRLVDGAQAQHAPPSGSQFCYVETKSIYSTGALLQIAWPYDGEGALLFRNYSQNAYSWSPWRKGFDSRNIIGPVSQSGGIPTGAIIERGSNANGGYVKFADGTMICNAVGYFGADANIAYGSIFKSPGYTWTFPAPFTVGTTPACSGKLSNWSAGWVGYEATVIDSNASAGFCVMTGTAISGASGLTVTLLAVGRWY
ncbi:hypothetical protein [Aeromonas caviae]|uniref:hypothetical protein n=1 Tax=Aeromonas caviae TaxID=648 RepID=UPI003F749CF9